MALSLSCPCGARFEVEDTFAGQSVSCPECQQPVQAVTVQPRPVRTSSLALASAVLALVLAFTGVGTALAVLLGLMALVVISRNRGRVTGVGYAVFGIVWGLVFTGLFVFAVARGEFFGVGDEVRERLMSSQVDRTGPMEVRRKGFAITRPTPKWGVARQQLIDHLGAESDLVLVQPSKEGWIAVHTYAGSLESFRQEYVRQRFHVPQPVALFEEKHVPHFSEATVKQSKRLEATKDGPARVELLIEVKMDEIWLTYLVHGIESADDDNIYYIEAWTHRKRFPGVEDEMRRCLNSFRVLGRE